MRTEKNAEIIENASYNKENLNPQLKGSEESSNTIKVPEGVDAELLMKVLGNQNEIRKAYLVSVYVRRWYLYYKKGV